MTAQAAKADLGVLEAELVRDLFISRMRNAVLQDTLTFERFTPVEVLKRAIKFEQIKQTTQAFQKSSTTTTNTGPFSNAQIKKKQEPIMAVGNKGHNPKRQTLDQTKRRTYENRRITRSRRDQKQGTRCGRTFGEGQLKPNVTENCN